MPLIYAERTINNLLEAEQILSRYPNLEWIDDYQTFRRENMHREKQSVIFAMKRGAWLKPFHCYHQNSEFTYLSLDLAEGCSFDCVYCYLQSYLNHGALVLFVNRDGIQQELQALKDQRLWISTGLLSDSFLAEEYNPQVAWLSHVIPENAVLELRTKSANTQLLQDPTINRDRVVAAWSLNPTPLDTHYEYGTATIAERLAAAKHAVSLGYRIAFHFDPVFYFEGWKTGYANLVQELESIPLQQLAFLSVGLFRYMPELGAIIRQRFPYHEILTEEFFPQSGGKYHYFRSIRKEMYGMFQEWLKPWNGRVPVFWSMEPDDSMIYRSFSSALLPSDF
jgi:spore photoproduct lyase